MKQEVYQYDRHLDSSSRHSFIGLDDKNNKEVISKAIEDFASGFGYKAEIEFNDFNDSIQQQNVEVRLIYKKEVIATTVIVEPGKPVESQVREQLSSKIGVF